MNASMIDKKIKKNSDNGNNSPNKQWWDNNPMTYVDWQKDVRKIEDKDSFKKLNSNYLDTNPYLRKYFSKIRESGNLDGKKIIDVGTGWGSSSILLSSCGGEVTAIDLSDASIAGAKMNYAHYGEGKINYLKMDAEKLEFPDNTFDYVYSWGVIHHSSSTDTAVREISRVLSSNGEGMIMVYNKLSSRYYLLGLWYLFVKGKILKGETLESVQKYFTDGYWHRHFTPKEFTELLTKNGLNVKKIELTYMARRILPGISEGSVVDEWLKRKFGWLLVATFSK